MIVRLVLVIFLVIFQLSFFAQDSFEKILNEGSGSLLINYRSADGFIFKNEDGNLQGVEYEILLDFITWIESKYGVEIKVEIKEIESFSGLYNSIKQSPEKGVFGICSFSITKERLQEVKFSPAYLPDVEVMISSSELPMLKDSSEFSKMVFKKF